MQIWSFSFKIKINLHVILNCKYIQLLCLITKIYIKILKKYILI